MDTDRIHQLSGKICDAVREHYRNAPAESLGNSETVFEALNSVAIGAAMILAGTGPDPKAITFFNRAVREQIDEVLKSISIHPGSNSKN